MQDGTQWWQTFFSGSWGRLQALGYPVERTAKEVDFIVDVLGLVPEESVLDVPCGIGRHAIELAKRGVRVTGVDLNPEALRIARQDAAAAAVDVDAVERDMRDLQWSARFDAAICFFGSFGYFDDSDNLRFVQRVAEALKPGGRFVIDTHVMESLFPVFRGKSWSRTETPSGSMLVLEDCGWNYEARRVETSWTFIGPNGVDTSASSIRIYAYGELCELLRAAGFRQLEGRETGTGEAFRLGSKRLSLVARL